MKFLVSLSSLKWSFQFFNFWWLSSQNPDLSIWGLRAWILPQPINSPLEDYRLAAIPSLRIMYFIISLTEDKKAANEKNANFTKFNGFWSLYSKAGKRDLAWIFTVQFYSHTRIPWRFTWNMSHRGVKFAGAFLNLSNFNCGWRYWSWLAAVGSFAIFHSVCEASFMSARMLQPPDAYGRMACRSIASPEIEQFETWLWYDDFVLVSSRRLD